MARHFTVQGYFDSSTRLQTARITITDDLLIQLRISGRRSQITIPWVPELEKLYQREGLAKARAVAAAPKRRRRLVSRGLLTAGR